MIEKKRLGYALLSGIAMGMLAENSLATLTVYGSPESITGASSHQFNSGSIGFIANNSDLNAVQLKQTNPSSANNPTGIVTVRWNASSASELETPDGYPSTPSAISDSGTIYGLVNITPPPGSTLYARSLKWLAGTTIPVVLNDLDGNATSQQQTTSVRAANASDLAVGWSRKSGFNGTLATRWESNNSITELGTIGVSAGGALRYIAEGVNNSGTTVGSLQAFTSGGGNGGLYAIRWNAGGTTATQIGMGYNAKQINSAGVIGGSDGNNFQAVRWSASATTPTLLRGPESAAVQTRFADLNDAGIIVGSADSHAAYWNLDSVNATPLTIPDGFANSYVSSINSSGIMVGHANNNSTDPLALLWDQAGSLTDLNSLIDPSYGWKLQFASYISDNGWISGRGLYDPDGVGGVNAYLRGYTLQIPEPTASMMLVSSGLLVLRRKRNRQD